MFNMDHPVLVRLGIASDAGDPDTGVIMQVKMAWTFKSGALQ